MFDFYGSPMLRYYVGRLYILLRTSISSTKWRAGVLLYRVSLVLMLSQSSKAILCGELYIGLISTNVLVERGYGNGAIVVS